MCTSKYKISIPEPCHEDWNKMSAEEQGRHCKVCAKTVIDFSIRTPEEVDRIIDENKGTKVCGRFRVSQITPSQFPPTGTTRTSSFTLQRFVAALFLVFGMSLFSCQAQEPRIMGDVMPEPPISHVVGQAVMLPPDTAVQLPKLLPELECEIVKGEIEVRNEHYIMGGPRFVEEKILPEFPVVADTLPVMKVGMIEYEEVPGILETPEIIIQGDTTEQRSIVFPPESGTELNVFPNPTVGNLNLEYKVTQRSHVSIGVYDMAGALRKEILNADKMYEGVYRMELDLGSLPNGMYFIRFMNGKEETVQKVLLQH